MLRLHDIGPSSAPATSKTTATPPTSAREPPATPAPGARTLHRLRRSFRAPSVWSRRQRPPPVGAGSALAQPKCPGEPGSYRATPILVAGLGDASEVNREEQSSPSSASGIVTPNTWFYVVRRCQDPLLPPTTLRHDRTRMSGHQRRAPVPCPGAHRRPPAHRPSGAAAHRA